MIVTELKINEMAVDLGIRLNRTQLKKHHFKRPTDLFGFGLEEHKGEKNYLAKNCTINCFEKLLINPDASSNSKTASTLVFYNDMLIKSMFTIEASKDFIEKIFIELKTLANLKWGEPKNEENRFVSWSKKDRIALLEKTDGLAFIITFA